MTDAIDQIKEHRALWVQGLRSGQFTQARGYFIETYEVQGDTTSEVRERHCCLAVATEVYLRNGGDRVRIDRSDPMNPRILVSADDEPDVDDEVDYDGTRWREDVNNTLPWPVAGWLGFDSTNPTLDGVQAVVRNDTELQTFKQIAEAIENTEV